VTLSEARFVAEISKPTQPARGENTMNIRIAAAGALALALVGTGAFAHVLDKIADKDAFKLRADVAKQQAGHIFCLVKAASKCEIKGVVSSAECDLSTGAVAYEPVPGSETAKFQAAIAKCDAKQDLDKKGTDYVGIGCPGDCDDADGIQRCADLPAYELTAEATGPNAIKGQLGLLSVLVDGGCAGEGAPDGAARIDCVKTAVSQLSKYASTVSKCQQKCELDATGKKGGGAATNAGVCSVDGVDVHPSITDCEAKAALKLTQSVAAGLAPVVTALLNDANDSLFNREDATDPDSPAGALSPCGTCGNGVREGTEACDGADLGVCGACQSDCACTPPAVDPILDGPAGTFCTTTVDTTIADFQPLCVPTAGTGRHFRIEGLQNLGNNGYVYLALGFPAAPTGNPATTAGDGRFILTGGKSVSCATGWTYFRYSGITDPSTMSLCGAPVYGGYNLGPAEVCVDVTAGAPARTTFWVTGENGADCKDADSLTLATALYSKSDWAHTDAVGTAEHFVKLSNAALATASSVSISSNTVLP